MLTKKRHFPFLCFHRSHLFIFRLLSLISLFWGSSSFASSVNQSVESISPQTSPLKNKTFLAEFQSEAQEYRNKSGHAQGAEIDHDLTFGVRPLPNLTVIGRTRITESLYPTAAKRYRNTKNSLGVKWVFSFANLNWKSKTLISRLNDPAGTEVELEFKSKYRLTPQFLYRLQLEHKENLTPGLNTFEKRQLKVEVTPMYTFSGYSLGLQTKWLARSFTTGQIQDEYGLDLAPIAKHESDSYEITLRQVFRPYRSSRKTLVSWESESTSALKIEISKEF